MILFLTRLTKLKRRALKNLVNTLPDRNILEIKEDEILYYVNNGFFSYYYQISNARN